MTARFTVYLRLLFQLHGLIATDLGESPEADDVRDRMDLDWAQLEADERTNLRTLSEEMYGFHARPRQTP